jgi:hypothetical protein
LLGLGLAAGVPRTRAPNADVQLSVGWVPRARRRIMNAGLASAREVLASYAGGVLGPRLERTGGDRRRLVVLARSMRSVAGPPMGRGYFQRADPLGAEAAETAEDAGAVGLWGTWTLTAPRGARSRPTPTRAGTRGARDPRGRRRSAHTDRRDGCVERGSPRWRSPTRSEGARGRQAGRRSRQPPTPHQAVRTTW